MSRSSTASICLAALVATLLLASGCSRTAPGAIATDCDGVTLTPGPCDEPFSTEPEPVVPESRCPTPAEVAQIDIPLSVSSDATAGTLACRADEGSVDLSPARAAIIRGLLFMKRVRFDAPLPWTTKPLYDWVRDSIPNGINVVSSGNSRACLSCAGPIIIFWPSGDRSPAIDTVSAVSIIVHETRHTNGFPHTCKPGEGGNTLDRSIAELGAMGADYYVRQWIATHSDEHPDTREYERKSAARLRRSFCCECGARTFAALLFRPPACGA